MSGLATFTPSQGSALNIGGSTNIKIPGPMPRYSISVEPLRSDAVLLGNKYSITVSGTSVIIAAASMLVNGQRQSELHKIIGYVALNKSNAGSLVLNPYGGATPITFNDCSLLSVEIPEQDEVSQGTQSQDYSFTFEAYKMTVNSISDDTIFGTAQPTKITEYSESWSSSVIEGQHTRTTTSDTNDTPNEPMYSISHSISAIGRQMGDGKSSYLNAKAFVDWRLGRLGNDPIVTKKDEAIVKTDIDIPFTPSTGYNSYNQVNSYNQDIQSGSYAVDRSWIISKAAASMTVELTSNIDPAAEYNSVDLSVVITGLDKSKGYVDSATTPEVNDKYANAIAVYGTVKSNLYNWAKAYYNTLGLGSSTLQENSRTQSRTDNKSDGVISISQSYNDLEISSDFPCATSQTVNYSETNAAGIQQVIAILPVIAKAGGPVIQNMSTTQERSRSATLDLQIKKEDNCRNTKPSGIAWLITNYSPVGVTNLYVTGSTDSWSPTTGAYSATVDWTWTDEEPTSYQEPSDPEPPSPPDPPDP